MSRFQGSDSVNPVSVTANMLPGMRFWRAVRATFCGMPTYRLSRSGGGACAPIAIGMMSPTTARTSNRLSTVCVLVMAVSYEGVGQGAGQRSLELRRRALRSGVFLLLDLVLIRLLDEGFRERKRIVLQGWAVNHRPESRLPLG